MTPLMVGQLIFIAASLFYIIRTASKMPKAINYSILGFVFLSMVAAVLIGLYRPEWMEPIIDNMTQLNNSLNI